MPLICSTRLSFFPRKQTTPPFKIPLPQILQQNKAATGAKMELQGHGGYNNPKALLSSQLKRREKLLDELRSVEKQVYELETSYLQETNILGNALKGFDGFLTSSKNTSNLKRPRKFQLEDRVFSLSSVTSPAVCPRQMSRKLQEKMENWIWFKFDPRAEV
ncbi:uncharacterized protein LOC142526846 isoform X2 [Primulina tabacum]|uniref:uncharacterized protein LOC142526846 isoform X2 n=1 Tax=Primulina tabacum TaxID=48773 RepID=UPI003F59C9BA